jgi:hypothetical protein
MTRPGIKFPPYATPDSLPEWNGGRPILFTISKYGEAFDPLFDVALALYVNPESLDESMTKVKNVVMTYGGFVEFVWPDELNSISASGSTGAFISPQYGVTAAPSKAPTANGLLTGRRGTIAYERFLDFLELFRSNGVLFDSNGVPQLRSRVIMMYDRGAFAGYFTTFEVAESEDKPFVFDLTWEFKVEFTIYKLGR